MHDYCKQILKPSKLHQFDQSATHSQTLRNQFHYQYFWTGFGINF